jgi:predicted acyltransferase
MWQVDYDPEGLFGALPSIVTCLCSVLVGKFLNNLKRLNFCFLRPLDCSFLDIFLVSGFQ